MKKIFFIVFAFLAIQTQAQVANGTETKQNAFRSMSPQTATTVNFLTTMGTDGTMGKVTPLNVTIPTVPLNYTVLSQTLGAHLQGIDTKLGQIVTTTAGVTTRVWFTADATTITAGTFYLTNATSKGTVASAIQNVVNDDNQKKYYTQDLIGQPFATATLFPIGVYAGNLSASTTPNSAQQRWTVELYKCNNAGTPIASGVTGAPVGDLGVTVIAILDSGLLTLADGSVTNVSVSGNLASPLSMAVGERIRYHVSAEKVGTAASNITQSVYYGTSYNSFLDVPVPLNTSAVQNLSTVTGTTTTDALNNLKAGGEISHNSLLNVQQAGTGVTNGHISDGAQTIAGIKTFSSGINTGSNASFGKISVNGNYSVLNTHSFDDYSVLTPISGVLGYGVFDASTTLAGATTNDHFAAYQARQKYTSSGNLTGDYGLTGFLSVRSHTGSGTIAKSHGIYLLDVEGTGTITYNAGIRIAPVLRGTENWAIDSEGGDSRFRGNILNLNGKGFYSFSVGDPTQTNQKGMSFVNDSNASFYSLGTGTQIPPDFKFYSYNGTPIVERLSISSSTGVMTVSNLSGTGTRTVVADASGNLSATSPQPLKYVALISQSGTSAPTATVLENTTGQTFTWSYLTTGQYKATYSSTLDSNKTTVTFINGAYTGNFSPSIFVNSGDITVHAKNGATATDGILSKNFFEVRIYP